MNPTDELAWEGLVAGERLEVPTLGGGSRRFVSLDNAASTPALESVRRAVDEFQQWYGSVHRGTGFKSQLSTWVLEEARQAVLSFVGANRATHTALFTRNTTEAINRLALLFPFEPGDVVLTTGMEHHANDLPWRERSAVIYAGVTPLGELDLDDLRRKLREHAGRVRLVSVTGASNVTGFVNPIHEIARLAHEHGALIMVDAAQLAPHRRIAMHAPAEAERIDFLALSGHKLYAPYGGGALVAPLGFLERVRPDHWGGGAVVAVSHTEVYLAGAPDRVEPGSPNVVGALAMARAMEVLSGLGMDRLDRHEQDLTAYALRRLREIPGIRLYGSSDSGRLGDRLGVIPFNVEGVPHELVAAVLAQESAVGVRSGCFCAHPYVIRLLGVDQAEYVRFRDRVVGGNRSEVPGLVRVSFGLYNRRADVDSLVEAVSRVAHGEYRSGYAFDPAGGEYSHPDYRPSFADYFAFHGYMEQGRSGVIVS